MLILNMYSMSKLYQYRIFPIARLLGPPTILYFPLIFPHARLFGTLQLLGTLEYGSIDIVKLIYLKVCRREGNQQRQESDLCS